VKSYRRQLLSVYNLDLEQSSVGGGGIGGGGGASEEVASQEEASGVVASEEVASGKVCFITQAEPPSSSGRMPAFNIETIFTHRPCFWARKLDCLW
jgi:hypothetical protein